MGERVYQFSRIADIERLADGRIAVLDGGSRELRLFSADGVYEQSIGRAGDGPGEFQFAAGFQILDGDIFQVDDVLRRIRYSVDGQLVDHAVLDMNRVFEATGAVPGCTGLPTFLDDDVFVCIEDNSATTVSQRQPGPWYMTQTVMRLPWTLDSVDTVGVFLEDEALIISHGGRLRFVFRPKYPEGFLTQGGDPRFFAFTQTDAYRIELRTWDGEPIRFIDRPSGHRDLTPEEIRSGLQNTASRLFFDTLRVGAAENVAPPADSISVLTGLLIDDLNRIWARAEDPSREPAVWYDLFEFDGRYLGPVDVPVGFTPVQITEDFVLGIRKDELDVEYVEMYRFVSGRQ